VAWFGGAAGRPSRTQQFTGVVAAALLVMLLGVGPWLWAEPGDGNDDSPGQVPCCRPQPAAEQQPATSGWLPEGPLVFGPAAAAVAPRGLVKAARTDRPVLVRGAAVVAVPADEGLWIEARGEQVWVQLRAPGESPVQVRRGMRLDVQAIAVQHGTGFARSVGLDAAAAAAAAARRLDRRGVHLQADPGDLTIR